MTIPFFPRARRLRLTPMTLGLLCALGAVLGAATFAGSLDSTFGGVDGPPGTAITTIPRTLSANALAVQPDGRLVAAGFGGTQNGPDFMLARFEPDGTLDTSFAGGIVTANVSTFSNGDAANAVVIQSDGKIVAAGSATPSGGGSDFALVRYNPDGTLDTSFGTGGKVRTDFAAGDVIRGLVVQADGRIVAAGSDGADFALARYNADGSLDTSFGTGGKVTTDFGGALDRAWALVLQSDGALIAGGNAQTATGQHFALARYASNGSLDTSFGAGGKVTTSFGATSGVRGLALQSNGRIVAAGLALTASGSHAFARYNSNGSPDTSFAATGRTVVNTGTGGWVLGVGIQSDGTIVGAGFGTGDFVVIGVEPDGNPFTVRHSDFAGAADGANAIAIRPGGTPVVAGTSDRRLAIAAYNSLLFLDASFGTAGTVTASLPGTSAAYAVDLQPDGKLISAGMAVGVDADVALIRYNPDGSLDSSFGANGIVVADLAFGQDSGAVDLVIQSDGKIVVLDGGAGGLLLARFNSDGSRDNAFGTNGRVLIAPQYGAFPSALVLQPDGKFVVGSTEFGSANYEFAVRRLNANGSIDTSFGTGGRAITAFGVQSFMSALVLTPAGQILAAGDRKAGNPASFDFDFALTRWNADGSFDSSFGAGGTVMTPFTAGTDGASSVVIQPDGKIIAAGLADGPSLSHEMNFALARYNTDGTLDASFGTDGKTVTVMGGQTGIRAVGLQADGKIVAGGALNGFAMARYNINGSLDSSFGFNGKISHFFGDGSDLLVQPDGNLVMAGQSNARQFTVARFLGATLPDPTPPIVSADVAGTLGANGWYTSDVALIWTVTEDESPESLVYTGCANASITTDQAAASYSCTVGSRGGTTGPIDVVIKRDATAPTLSFTGNAGTYTIAQQIAIDCAASDVLSGVASDCADIRAPAYTFAAGPNTVNRSAADKAGNTGTGSVSFLVTVDSASLCSLGKQFVQGSARYQQLGPGARRQVDGTLTAACTYLTQIVPQLGATEKAILVGAYKKVVGTLVSGGWLTVAQGATLTRLVDYL